MELLENTLKNHSGYCNEDYRKTIGVAIDIVFLNLKLISNLQLISLIDSSYQASLGCIYNIARAYG